MGFLNRFVDRGVREGPAGPAATAAAASAAAAVGAARLPAMIASERKSYIRLCKRLEDGGSASNTKKMAGALALRLSGSGRADTGGARAAGLGPDVA